MYKHKLRQKSAIQKKCILSAMVIFALATTTACGKSDEQIDSSDVQSQQIEQQEKETKIEPEPNTSEKVDAIAFSAKDAAKESITDAERDEAIDFIVEHYPDYYTDNETMEQTMFYGFWLDYAYKDDEANQDYAKLGTDVAQAVKYVYCGTDKIEDDATQLNLEQVQKGLETLGYTVNK